MKKFSKSRVLLHNNYEISNTVIILLSCQSPAMVREFTEKYIVPELTDDLIKEICQFEHPKFMLQQLNPGINFMAKYALICHFVIHL